MLYNIQHKIKFLCLLLADSYRVILQNIGPRSSLTNIESADLDPSWLALLWYSKTCVKRLLKIDKSKVLITNGSLTKVKELQNAPISAIHRFKELKLLKKFSFRKKKKMKKKWKTLDTKNHAQKSPVNAHADVSSGTMTTFWLSSVTKGWPILYPTAFMQNAVSMEMVTLGLPRIHFGLSLHLWGLKDQIAWAFDARQYNHYKKSHVLAYLTNLINCVISFCINQQFERIWLKLGWLNLIL